ncbi:unnamed protein product [Calypogeia fissa]
MITRNRARKALAELQQQQVSFEVKQSADRVSKDKCTSAGSEQLSADGVAIIAKKMNVISLDSGEEDSSSSKRDAIDLSESSKSFIDLSSSEDGDDDYSDISEDEDGSESDYSEDENCSGSKSTSSTPARQLLADEVAKLIRGGDLKKLKADDCKAYLRNYGLLVTGTKPVLVDRIKQHLELKEGGSRAYARSTLTIDCTGDVCKGDVVMFNQKVYNKHSVTARSAAQSGSRTVVGRVVKESYGAQRQQHTFTVEVLWSTGCRPLSPMKPLLVKGRNLYRRKTFRQEWADEGDRTRCLDEKHERGAAARQIRAIKQGRFKGRQGNGGRVGLEGSSRKQLANPYTDTLASKENNKYSSRTVSQSVSGHRFASVGTQQRVVHHHTRTGANTVPLGRIRQFGLPSENGDATTSVQKHRQWLKPSNLLLPSEHDAHKQHPSEVQNVSRSSQRQGGSSRGSQSGPCILRKSVSIQAPRITISVPEGGGLTSGITHSHDSKSASLRNRPSSPAVGRPVSPSPYRDSVMIGLGPPSTPFVGRPASPLPNRPSAPSFDRPVSRSQNRPSAPSFSRPVSPLANRPSGPSSHRPVSPLPNRPSGPSFHRPVSPLPNRPSGPSFHRPVSPSPNRPCAPLLDRPVSGFPNSPSAPSYNRPLSNFHDRPSAPSLGRSLSPLPKRSHIIRNDWVPPSPSRPSCPAWGRPLSPFANRPSVTNDFLGSAPSSPLRDRHGSQFLHRRPSPTLSRSQDGFSCPTQSCTYRGSGSCSNGVCYHCCNRRGGACRNPRHRPQLNVNHHEFR